MAAFAIRDRIASWIADELKHNPATAGSEFGYEIAMSSTRAKGRDTASWAILVTLRHPLIGHDAIGAITKAVTNVPNEAAVRTAVSAAVSRLRSEHDRIVTEARQTADGRGSLPDSLRGRLN